MNTKFYCCTGFHVNIKRHNLAETLIDACINKGAAQHQETDKTSDAFQTVLTDVNLISDIFFFSDIVVLEVKKIQIIRTTYIIQVQEICPLTNNLSLSFVKLTMICRSTKRVENYF